MNTFVSILNIVFLKNFSLVRVSRISLVLGLATDKYSGLHLNRPYRTRLSANNATFSRVY